MPMEYLRGLERDTLPLIETDVVNIDKLRILRAAGMVEVQLPPVDSPQQNAQVLYVTGLGCATLRACSLRAGSVKRVPRADMESFFD
jgi:hypothetical protein|nr:hypothetical protein [uncultured Acidovorax sp.]